MSLLRIVIADRSEIWRRGLRRLLNEQPDFLVVSDVAEGANACAEVAEWQPDVAILALTVPALEALRTASRIKQLSPSVSVVILSDCPGPGFAETASAAGADAYVTKQAGPLELVRVIRRTVRRRSEADRSPPRASPTSPESETRTRAALVRHALDCDWPRREQIT